MATTPSPTELTAALAAKAAQIPSLRAVRLDADYVPARLPSGKVTGVWGVAIIRTPEGDLRELVVGDEIRKGDVIMTSQNGIVEIDDAATRLARFPMPEALEQILTDLEPPGAGLTGGDPGSLQPALRVDRLSEVLGGQAFVFDGAERATPLAAAAAPVDDTQPGITVSSPSIVEGATGTSGFAVFTVTLTGPNPGGTTVQLGTTDGSATGGGVDYGTPGGSGIEVSLDGGTTWTPGTTATVPAGGTNLLVRVPVVGDGIDEPDESFTVTVTTPNPNAPGGSTSTSGTATITDDDPTPTVVSVTPLNPDTNNDGIADVPEGTGGVGNPMVYTVTLSNLSTLPVTLGFSLAGTGAAPADPAADFATAIEFSNGVTASADGTSITVPPNVQSFIVTVRTNPDALDEDNEGFVVSVGGLSASASIIDDDGVPVIDIDGPGDADNLQSVNYTENQPPVLVAPLLALADPDSDALSGATVSLGAGFQSAQDVLAFGTLPAGISGSYNAGTGVLTLNGAGTLAAYQAALRTVTYANTSEAPDATARTVSFVVIDDRGRPSAPANATVTVTPVNDTPLAAADALNAQEDTAITFTAAQLLANDSDVDNANSELSIATVTQPTDGTVVLNPDGSIGFTPNANFNGSTSFTYTVTDGQAQSAPQTVTISVAPFNDAPTIGPVTLAAIAEDSGARTITQAELLAGANDVDNPVASLVATGLTIAAGNGTLVDNGNGTWTYTPAANDDTAVSFAYTVSDGSGGSAAGSAALDITPVNDAPVTSPVTLGAIAEDSGARIITQAELLANATDVDSPALVASGLTIGSGNGTLVDNGDGTWTYTPAANDDTAVSFTYTVSDGSGGTVPGSATMDITPVNDVPVNTLPTPTANPTDLDGLSTPEDTPLVFSASNVVPNAIMVTDVDGDVLTTVVSVDRGTLTLAGSAAAQASVTVSGTAAEITAALEGLTYRNPADYFTRRENGTNVDVAGVQLTVTTTDASGPIATSADIVVQSVSDIQSFTMITQQNTALPTPISLQTIGAFEDPGARITEIGVIPSGSAIPVMQAISAGGAPVEIAGLGSFNLDALGQLGFKPATDFVSQVLTDGTIVTSRVFYTVAAGDRTERIDFGVQVTATASPTQANGTAQIQSFSESGSADEVISASSSDVLVGTAGRDVFAWTLADRGEPGAPKTFTIDGFNAGTDATADALDLRDLLSGESSLNLDHYLDLSRSGNDTVIAIASGGGGAADVTITLTGVDLAAAVGLPDAGEAQVIAELVKQGRLLADSNLAT